MEQASSGGSAPDFPADVVVGCSEEVVTTAAAAASAPRVAPRPLVLGTGPSGTVTQVILFRSRRRQIGPARGRRRPVAGLLPDRHRTRGFPPDRKQTLRHRCGPSSRRPRFDSSSYFYYG